MQASTTGNIYGIYDMAGGAYECTSAYINNAHPYLTSYGSSIINADAKYKDIYILGGEDNSLNNYSSAIDKKGDAIYETSVGGELSTSWNSDMSDMPRSTTPWFTRGGRGGISGTSVGTFYFGSFGSGAASAIVGFRSVLLIEAKL
jgi:hypothetical protein